MTTEDVRLRGTFPERSKRWVVTATGRRTVAARALARRHRVLHAVVVPLMHRLSRYRTMHYELHAGAS
jgi:hypothetical protein